MNYQKGPHNPVSEEECNCCIKVDNSLVLIICGELDRNQLENSLKTFLEVKDGANVITQD